MAERFKNSRLSVSAFRHLIVLVMLGVFGGAAFYVGFLIYQPLYFYPFLFSVLGISMAPGILYAGWLFKKGRDWFFIGEIYAVAVASVVGSAVLGASLISIANGSLDNSPGEVRQVQVQKKVMRGSGDQRAGQRGTYRYFLVVPAWEPGKGRGEIQVKESLFKSVEEWDHIEVTLKPGSLGFRWVGNIEKVPSERITSR